MKCTLSVLFENRVDTIPRITGLFSGKGFNLHSISFGPENREGLTRMTITTEGEERKIEQLIKQLFKVVDVTTVIDLSHQGFVERELALVKVYASAANQSDILQIGSIFRANVVDISPESLTLEVTGKEDKINAAVGMLQRFGIQEVSRTGSAALKREFQGRSQFD